MQKILCASFFMALLVACTPLQFAVVNAPMLTYDGQISIEVPYGQLPRQKLDIYVPDINQDTFPVVVFFHGGRWSEGSKDQYKFLGMKLSNMGYVVVLPNTRLYPEVKFPTFAEDAAKSVAWVHKNIARYKGNDNLFISGHSSGAHLGALIIADQSYLAVHRLNPNIVNAFAGLSGPYDFEPKAADIRDMFGPLDNFPKMVVTNFIDGDEPPMLLIYTAQDSTVHPRNLTALKTGIEKAKGEVHTIIYKTGGHIAPIAAFSWANPSGLPVPRDVDDFFKKFLR
ncbi:MAG: acetyl esterase/lipase [Methylophagaceae bacterium]|jgi:acetyl esterase/lipase